MEGLALECVHEQITGIVKENALPVAVVQDVNFRLQGCDCVHYARQQLQFLQRVVEWQKSFGGGT